MAINQSQMTTCARAHNVNIGIKRRPAAEHVVRFWRACCPVVCLHRWGGDCATVFCLYIVLNQCLFHIVRRPPHDGLSYQ